MPSLPPSMWAELFYGGAWHDVTGDLLQRTPVTVTRGLSSESASQAEPTACTCDLASRDNRYAPRNPSSPLYGLIGRNTGFRWGYEVGSPWAAMSGAVTSQLSTPDAPQLDVTDLDVRIDLAMEDWDRQCMLGGRYVPSGDNRCWGLTRAGSGQIAFYWSPDGTVASVITRFSTANLVACHGQRLTLRITLDVNNGAGGYELCFYTGRTVDDTDWTPLGEPVVGTSTTAVYNGTAGIQLGNNIYLVGDPMIGRVHAFKLLNGIDGTTAAHMTTSDAEAGDTSFTSHGLTWTVQGGVTLTNRHVRMAGEVPAWPPTRDLSGNDNYVSINPSGVTRRMDAGNRPQDSALLRYIKAQGPIECWPLTDGPQTTGAKSLVGGQDLQQEIIIGEDTAADWQKGSLADWIEPVLSAKANTTGDLRGGLPYTAGAAAAWSVDLFLSGGGIPSAGQLIVYDRGAGTDTDTQVEFHLIFNGQTNEITATWSAWGDTVFNSGLLGNLTAAVYDEQPHHLRLSVDPTGSNTAWTVYVDGQSVGSGTITGTAAKAAREVTLGWGFATIANTTMSDRSFGYITYWDGNGPTASEIYNAYMGFQGERAGARIVRLATEAGYTASVAGETGYQQRMGIQGQKQLLELLNEAAATDFGFLLDRRDAIEVVHRGGSTLWNQPPALTLDYSAGLISPPFRPVDDDRLTENDVSVKREFGSVPAREVLEEGEMSVLPPEDGGVGRYDTSYTYSLYTDDQARQVAGMRLHLGTYNGVRYTRLALNLANERVYQYVDDILRLDVGDKIRLTNLPADHGPDDVDVLVTGYSEEAGPDGWTITFNCVPGEPWTAGVVGSDTYGHVDTAGSELSAAVDATATSVPVITTAGPRWVDSAAYPDDFPFDVRTGGEVMRVTAIRGPVLDTFQRVAVNAWAAASSGLVWSFSGGSASDYSVSGGLGRMSHSTAGVRRIMSLPVALADVDVTITWAMPVVPAGDSAYVMLAARYGSVNDQYFARVQVASGGAASLTLRKRVAGPESQLATLALGITVTAGTRYRLRFQVTGTTLQAKCWRESDTEPTSWQLTATDTDLTGPSDIAVWSLIGAGLALPFVVTFDDVTIDQQLLTVVRSINGVSKAHPAGQDIRLANPVYVAM